MKKQIILTILSVLISNFITAQPQPFWKFKTAGKIAGSPCVSNNKIIIGSEDGFLYAIDKTNGQQLWKYQGDAPIKSTPATVNGTVFFNNANGNMYAIDATSGKMLWKQQMPGEKIVDFWDYYLSSPVLHDNLVIVGSGNGAVYAFDQKTGKQVWTFKTDGVVHADPLIQNNTVYVGSFDGNFYSLNATSGQLLWKFKTVGDMFFPKGEIQNGASFFNNTVYFGSRDFNIYALNAEKGTGAWNMKERGSWVIATPAIADSLAFFGTSDTHTFYCLGALYSEVKWKIPLNMRVYGKAAFYENLVLFGCFNGKLYAADKKTGTIKWEYQTEASKQNWLTIFDETGHIKKGFELYGDDVHIANTEKIIMNLGSILSSPIVEQNMVYFGSTDGYVYALKM
ncbi:outer membrane protein assembly factor BamB family protein [Solitalea canadensis]|uniref:PQQ enzyme repeat-containing protein n=1 Tax=Solitalea canadensis (strain ATCC 29591 / DSM 3403 / JCM 21819 / LMG 8368 / NBRC 15130 / NCIMB 12057 / USAM 9D) TaxID=929556 RepID=H8KUK0_SOLCM|nr:PQQ-binding-like beta-propeller repeat protein [Solitalea canadensis]AFD07424.1 PQQ enzyme repeat-containing protein [Solitalea canadensis DSM 3403]